jgi:hypothetical protein
LKIIFVRRMGDDFPCGIDLVSSGGVNVTALVMLASLNTAPELFEALAESRLGYLKALLYPNGQSGDRRGWVCVLTRAEPYGSQPSLGQLNLR